MTLPLVTDSLEGTIVSLKISDRLYVSNLPLEIKQAFKKAFTLENPLYWRLKNSKNTKALWITPKEFKYYYELSENIIAFPRGLRSVVEAHLIKKQIKYSLKEELIEINCNLVFNSNIELRDYQKNIIDDVLLHDYREGIFHMSTGSGKTIMMLEYIIQRGLTATILVPNTLVLRQIEKEAKKFYNFLPSIIGDGEKKVGAVTISTFQSLFNNPGLLKQLSDNTSILMIDECHGVVSEEREKVIRQFRPKYLYGFSATLDREDGKAKAIQFYCGKVIARHEMTMMTPEVELRYSNIHIPALDYPEMVRLMTENESRNNLILGEIITELLNNRKILVLTKRVAHAELLFERLPRSPTTVLISSDDKERNNTLSQLKSGEKEFNCVIGTTSLLSTGFDLPQLDTLILACDMRSSILTQQSVGRILRLFTNKSQPRIIDIVDSRNRFFLNQAKHRQLIYNRMGWKIIDQYDFN